MFGGYIPKLKKSKIPNHAIIDSELEEQIRIIKNNEDRENVNVLYGLIKQDELGLGYYVLDILDGEEYRDLGLITTVGSGLGEHINKKFAERLNKNCKIKFHKGEIGLIHKHDEKFYPSYEDMTFMNRNPYILFMIVFGDNAEYGLGCFNGYFFGKTGGSYINNETDNSLKLEFYDIL